MGRRRQPQVLDQRRSGDHRDAREDHDLARFAAVKKMQERPKLHGEATGRQRGASRRWPASRNSSDVRPHCARGCSGRRCRWCPARVPRRAGAARVCARAGSRPSRGSCGSSGNRACLGADRVLTIDARAAAGSSPNCASGNGTAFRVAMNSRAKFRRQSRPGRNAPERRTPQIPKETLIERSRTDPAPCTAAVWDIPSIRC